MNLRSNLSGKMRYMSFIPPKISEYQFCTDDSRLSELSELSGELEGQLKDLTEDKIKMLERTEAYDSWQLSEARANQFSFFMSRDNENADNIVEATDYAVDSLGSLPISTRLIRNIHYLICRSSDYDKKYRGEYRSSPVWIGKENAGLTDAMFVPPVAADMDEAISDLENYINYSEDNIFVKTAVFHYQFEMIHPFIDGNGRTGRLLNNLILTANGVLPYPVLLLSHIIARNYNGYCDAIQYVNETGDISVWVKYWLDTMNDAIRYTIQAIKNLDYYD